jgi:autotransporter-associated beta strand protein
LDLFGKSQTLASINVDQSVGLLGGIANFSSNTIAGNGAAGTLIINGNHTSSSFNGPIGALSDGFFGTGTAPGSQVMGNDNIVIQLANTNTGSLTLSNANTYMGGTIVGGGTLIVGNQNALGLGGVVPLNKTVIGSTTISTGGTLDLHGNTINEPINLAGGTLMSSSGSAGVSNGVKGLGFTAAGTTLSGDASITITGNGSNASATPLLGLTQNSISLTNGGSGYNSVARTQVGGGSGTNEIVVAQMGLTNSSVSVTNQGTGYTSAPSVTFSGSGTITPATGHAIIDGSGKVTSIVVDTPGKGYVAAPTVTLAGGGGTGATAAGTFAGLVVSGLSLTSPGIGFTSAPSITILPPTTGTAATANIDGSHFQLIGIQETNTGNGYLTAGATINSSTGAGGAVLGSPVLPTLTLTSTGGIGGDNDLMLPVNVTGAGGFTKFGADTVTIGGSTSYTGNVTVASGTLVFAGGPSFLAPLSGTASTTVNSGARLVFDYTSTISPTTALRNQLLASYPGNFTSGPFRTPGADSRHGLGYFDDGTSKVTVRFTYYGDADNSGQVTTSDFTTMAQHFGSVSARWQDGDFNYDGVVNALDFNAIATNFGAAAIPAPVLGSVVPEPVSLGLLGCAGLLLARRRRA